MIILLIKSPYLSLTWILASWMLIKVSYFNFRTGLFNCMENLLIWWSRGSRKIFHFFHFSIISVKYGTVQFSLAKRKTVWFSDLVLRSKLFSSHFLFFFFRQKSTVVWLLKLTYRICFVVCIAFNWNFLELTGPDDKVSCISTYKTIREHGQMNLLAKNFSKKIKVVFQ